MFYESVNKGTARKTGRPLRMGVVKMFTIGNIVMHPTAGVCQIDDIRDQSFNGVTKKYYILHPMSNPQKSTIYTPVDSDAVSLRRLLTEPEIQELILASRQEQLTWTDNANIRKGEFNAILHSDNVARIIALVTLLHRRREVVEASGRKFPIVDERIMLDAEKRIHQEFSYALKIAEEEVPEYIISRLYG